MRRLLIVAAALAVTAGCAQAPTAPQSPTLSLECDGYCRQEYNAPRQVTGPWDVAGQAVRAVADGVMNHALSGAVKAAIGAAQGNSSSSANTTTTTTTTNTTATTEESTSDQPQ